MNSIYLDSVEFRANSMTLARKSHFYQLFGGSIGSLNDTKMTFATGGGIYCYECSRFYMSNSKITNAEAKKGGGIFLEQTEISKNKQTDSA